MILVVDDDKVLTQLLRKLLEENGFEVQTASDGEEAYRHLRDPQCRGMLLDMRMPGINGAELLMLMAADGVRVPVVIMAGFPDYDEEELKQFPNVRRMFRKPFYPEEMLAAVREMAAAKA